MITSMTISMITTIPAGMVTDMIMDMATITDIITYTRVASGVCWLR